MSELCWNELRIVASKGRIRYLKNKLFEWKDGEAQEIAFNAIIPAPMVLTGSREDWEVENWGCVGITYNLDVTVQEESITASFYTVSEPMTGIIARIASENPNVKVDHLYANEDEGFCGITSYADGRCTYDMYGNQYHRYRYDDYDADNWDEWPKEIPMEKEGREILVIENKVEAASVTLTRFSYKKYCHCVLVCINGTETDSREERTPFSWPEE